MRWVDSGSASVYGLSVLIGEPVPRADPMGSCAASWTGVADACKIALVPCPNADLKCAHKIRYGGSCPAKTQKQARPTKI